MKLRARQYLLTILLIALLLVSTNFFKANYVSHAGFLFAPSFTENTVAGSYNGAADIFASDLDGDGDICLVYTSDAADDLL